MPTSYTLTFSEGIKGWPSFYSYQPEYIKGMNQFLYTFKNGDLYVHNSNDVDRNNFYGAAYSSTIKSVVNDTPLENKLFKTLNLEGDSPWSATLDTDLQDTGFIQSDYFELKEAAYHAFVRNSKDQSSPFANPAGNSQYALRSVQGIGTSTTTSGGATFEIKFSINPLVPIPSAISVGDFIYHDNSSPTLTGTVTSVERDLPNNINRIIVDTSLGTVPVGNQYFMFIKNSIAESNGVLGHYCVFELTNTSTSAIELFAVETEVMKSFP
jgi:hypothetical protein